MLMIFRAAKVFLIFLMSFVVFTGSARAAFPIAEENEVVAISPTAGARAECDR